MTRRRFNVKHKFTDRDFYFTIAGSTWVILPQYDNTLRPPAGSGGGLSLGVFIGEIFSPYLEIKP